MWSMTSFIKLNSGSLCPANLLTVKHVETCVTLRIEALVLFHTQSNKKYIYYFFLQVGDQRQWERHTATNLSRFLSSEAGGMTGRTLDPGWLPEVELVKANCWCTTWHICQETSCLMGPSCLSGQVGRCCRELSQECLGVGRQTCISPRELSL